MSILKTTAFNNNAFKEIKEKINSDLQYPESELLLLKLKSLKQSFPLFYLIMLLSGISLLFLREYDIRTFILLLLLVLSVLSFPILVITTYILYRIKYHEDYIKTVSELEKVNQELSAKSDAEDFAINLFLQKRGNSIYSSIELLLKEEELEDHLKSLLLQRIKYVLEDDESWINQKTYPLVLYRGIFQLQKTSH